MDQREAFIADWLARRSTLGALCEDYGISRKTGSKWVQRFYDGGLSGLVDRSRRPLVIPHRVSEEIAERIIRARQEHRLWGPKKLKAWLEQRDSDTVWPAPSTIGLLLKERGLIPERRKRLRTPRASEPLSAATAPNATWCTDFKGCFRVGGKYCHPLTISDAFSRYLLCVQTVAAEREELVMPVFETVFREYGLPLRMRSDNGAPFASRSIGGLSRLSVWWIRLGITPERIEPGCPQQNGRHERMHRTLKSETAQPPRANAEAQQEAFDEFRRCFNEERPHEALGNRTPISVYQPSSRSFPDTLSDPEYPEGFDIQRVGRQGKINLFGGSAVLSRVLIGQAIGIESVDDGRWRLWFGPVYLGLLSKVGKARLEFLKNSSPLPRI
jgi:transposase InsO family protein